MRKRSNFSYPAQRESKLPENRDEIMNNDSAIDILLKMFEESYALARQAEDQRATMSNYLITVSAVLFAFVTQQGFTPNVIPISILIVF